MLPLGMSDTTYDGFAWDYMTFLTSVSEKGMTHKGTTSITSSKEGFKVWVSGIDLEAFSSSEVRLKEDESKFCDIFVILWKREWRRKGFFCEKMEGLL